MIVYRQQGDDLEITLASDESLGILDTGYLEDYFGVDGQVSLHHLPSGARFALSMSDVPATTPGIPNDYFLGLTPLSGLPDGLYDVEGRVRDLFGNYTILSAFATPAGGERVIPLSFEIRDGVPYPPVGTALVRAVGSDYFVLPAAPFVLATNADFFVLPANDLVQPFANDFVRIGVARLP